MKFARYLEETQAPEWKKAYIDYRGLKKRITACRREKELSNSKRPASPQLDHHSVTTRSHGAELQPDDASLNDTDDRSIRSELVKSVDLPPPVVMRSWDTNHGLSSKSQAASTASGSGLGQQARERDNALGASRSRGSSTAADHPRTDSNLPRAATLNMGMLPRLQKCSTFRLPNSLRQGSAGRWELTKDPKAPWDPTRPLSLADLMPLLTSTQRGFFAKLDSELDKVETFYLEREKEMTARTQALKAQLHELQMHRTEYYAAHEVHSWTHFVTRPKATTKFTDAYRNTPSLSRSRSRHGSTAHNASSSRTDVRTPTQDAGGSSDPDSPTSFNTTENGTGKKVRHSLQKKADATQALALAKHDPEEYYHAKKKLKKAVLECYRGLEILNNYRTLNLIGFRKALKKFEKVTRVPAQQAYTVERIEPNAFTSAHAVDGMMKDLEELFAARFTKGDKKKALTRLRGGAQQKSHHFNGIVESFQADTRAAIPAWDGLLYVYSICFVPVFFALLVGLNLQVWSTSRINYVFIFELELRTKLDHRQYYEIPAFLMSTLCYAFWLSFKRIGEHGISPTLWPLIWLALVFCVLFNPLPIYFKRSRYWLVQKSLNLLISGTHRVEFTDFWMGDQFCSLIFTLSNLYFIPCAYAGGLDKDWQRCTSKTPNWGVPFVLASLPLLARAVQSVKRYYDSRLPTHLVNGGKYATGIVYYLCYFIWRHEGGGRDASFVAWCVFGISYSIYAAAWDLLMDWSLLRPHVNHTFLRSDILYTSAVPVYYFAIVSNVLLRFSWVFYIPEKGPNFLLRTFITAMLEVLRRWQWNFFRLENEHLGNVDQYRVTREVPLPYTLYDDGDDTDDEDNHSSKGSSKSGSRKSLSVRWRGKRAAPAAEDDDQLSSD
ncbi:hypothetical protein EUX98_g1237 [Antrodiella citrinella]|uniref:SPX domain-containing protein n=1 Tax=Antrodiella citrinella TaxID=2447956 RepID=A0A4S4N4T9_9APHY|nr:hypothetical protein EUX98_g1237 [Antrodiella citrinella]